VVVIRNVSNNMESIEGVRRSRRICAKGESKKKARYIEHIGLLHAAVGELLSMSGELEVEKLRKIISAYEGTMGDLLNISG
jgi:hypothetical protein